MLLPWFLPMAAWADVSVTVYDQDLGVVREERSFDLQPGEQVLRFTDVAASIDPTSVVLKGPEGFRVLEQDLNNDLVSTEALLERYLGQELSWTDKDGKTYSGKLLSFDAGQIVLGLLDGSVQMVNRSEEAHLDFPELPGGLTLKPTLVWKVKSPSSGPQPLSLSYMTNGLSWHAEYAALLSADGDRLDLTGWVSVDNESGTDYRNARLQVVAGDVNRVQPPMRFKAALAEAAVAPNPQFQEQPLFEYHLYALDRPTDLLDKQVKQVQLLQASGIAVARTYRYDGSQDGDKVRVALQFQNTQAAGMGLPLPAGKVRVYQVDADKAEEFIGEDTIDHTPKDGAVTLHLGNAFDLAGQREVLDERRIDKNTTEQDIRVTLKNHKAQAVKVLVIEHAWGRWKVVHADHDFTKQDAATLLFPLEVPAGSQTVLNYTLRTGNGVVEPLSAQPDTE